LPYGFDISKSSNWSGATYDSDTGKLTIDEDNTGTINYDYDTGYESVTFKLIFTTNITSKPETTTTTPTTTTVIKGDINGDGSVNSIDAVFVLKDFASQILGNKSTLDVSIADMNDDGKINSSDAVIILKQYAQSLINK
jgi:hypothetical protein